VDEFNFTFLRKMQLDSALVTLFSKSCLIAVILMVVCNPHYNCSHLIKDFFIFCRRDARNYDETITTILEDTHNYLNM
jgi:hypothetical protein